MPTNAKNFQNKITIHLKIAQKWGYQYFGPIPWEFDFQNFYGFLEMRG